MKLNIYNTYISPSNNIIAACVPRLTSLTCRRACSSKTLNDFSHGFSGCGISFTSWPSLLYNNIS